MFLYRSGMLYFSRTISDLSTKEMNECRMLMAYSPLHQKIILKWMPTNGISSLITLDGDQWKEIAIKDETRVDHWRLGEWSMLGDCFYYIFILKSLQSEPCVMLDWRSGWCRSLYKIALNKTISFSSFWIFLSQFLNLWYSEVPQNTNL